ncbi:hypothetical protein [Parasphingorhabdus sp.]|uniref:phage head completion protein n=1 Tax=Parasphingorhabdus sp. TaxID=2709688 RepID=UPI00326674C0
MPKNIRPEFAGKLHERILIERPTAVRDGAGSASGEFESIGDFWAGAEAHSSMPDERAESRAAMPVWQFVLRLAEEILPGDHIVWNARRLIVRTATAEFRPVPKTTLIAEETR